jgi:hypothetical protein
MWCGSVFLMHYPKLRWKFRPDATAEDPCVLKRRINEQVWRDRGGAGSRRQRVVGRASRLCPSPPFLLAEKQSKRLPWYARDGRQATGRRRKRMPVEPQ